MIMILRNEEGRAIGAERLSDVTDEIADVEKVINKALKNKRKGNRLSDEERDALTLRVKDLGVLVSSISDELKHGANTMEIIAFIREIAKLKKLTESIAECCKDD